MYPWKNVSKKTSFIPVALIESKVFLTPVIFCSVGLIQTPLNSFSTYGSENLIARFENSMDDFA